MRDVLIFVKTLDEGGRRIWSLQEQLVCQDERRQTCQRQVSAAPIDGRNSLKVDPGSRHGRKQMEKQRQSVWQWWMKCERQQHRPHTNYRGIMQPWFHGQIDRDAAESLLTGVYDGTFLVRVATRTEGYVLSFFHGVRVHHYRIEAFDEDISNRTRCRRYKIAGGTAEVPSFTDLYTLLQYYMVHPLTAGQKDVLTAGLDRQREGPFTHHGLEKALCLRSDYVDPLAAQSALGDPNSGPSPGPSIPSPSNALRRKSSDPCVSSRF